MPFDYEKFSAECDGMTEAELHKQWENYTRHISGGSTSTAISVLAAPFTVGVSLIGLGLSAPRIHNARKKREIIEVHLQSLGSTHHTRKRDVFGSMALSGTIGAVTLGMAPPGSEVIGEIGITHGIAAIVENPATVEAVVHVAADGVGAGLEEAHEKKRGKKAKKQLKRDHEMMLRQFQRWKAEEEKIKLENAKVRQVDKTSTTPDDTLPEYTIREEHVNEKESQRVALAVAETDATVGESDSSDDEREVVSDEDDISFADYLEMKKMWTDKHREVE